MKRAYVLITPEFLETICRPTENYTISIESTVPIDAEFISATFMHEKDCFYVLFEHDSFANIPEGEMYPQIEKIIFTQIRTDEI